MAEPIKTDSGKWIATVGSRDNRKSKTFRTKTEAVIWQTAQQKARQDEKSHNLVTGMTFGRAIHRYMKEVTIHKKGCKWERNRLVAIAKFILYDNVAFGDILLREMSESHLDMYSEKRQKIDGVTPGTVLREIKILSNVFTYCIKKWRYMKINPTVEMNRPLDNDARDRTISQLEIDAIRKVLQFPTDQIAVKHSHRIAIAFLFAIETGMRLGELCLFAPKNVFDSHVHLPKEITKGGYARDVPLSDRAVELLGFLQYDSDQKSVFNLNANSVTTSFKKYTKKAGVIDLHFHDTRHEAITRLSKWMHILALAKMVGHKDLKMLQRYYNEKPEDIAKSLRENIAKHQQGNAMQAGGLTHVMARPVHSNAATFAPL